MVEVAAALAISAASIVAIFSAMRVSSGGAHHSRMLTGSVLLAETLLSEARLGLYSNPVFETRSGQKGSYRWRVRTVPTAVENLGAICVRVTWRQQHRHEQYDLVSLVHVQPTFEGK